MTPPFDSYSLRAQLFPALIATAPVVALFYTLVPWDSFHPSQLVATLGAGALLYGFTDLASEWGRGIQLKIFNSIGGMPSTRLLRYRDQEYRAREKQRWHEFLAEKICMTSPTERDEIERPTEADLFYKTAGNWLRQNTRDRAKYRVLFEKNVSYGYRRNVLALKTLGLTLNLSTLTACALLVVYGHHFGLNYDYPTFYFVFIIAAAHATYFIFFVNLPFAARSAEEYGRHLIHTIESLIT